MRRTGHELLKYLDLERTRDRLDAMTVSTYKTSCRSVLAALPLGLEARLDTLDLIKGEDAFMASEPAQRIAPRTRATYVSSFKAAVRAFLADSEHGGDAVAGEQPPFVTYAFPLRRDGEAQLEVPRDLTAGEADRLCAFVQSLVIN
jgi:hypothetical protein